MDPRQEVSESGSSKLRKTSRTPHQTNLILTVLDGTGFLLFPAIPGLTGCVTD